MELISIANLFLMFDLKNICESKLLQEITIMNVVQLYKVSKASNAEQLKSSCMDFMVDHFTEVSQTQKFKEEISEDQEIASRLPPELLASFMFSNYDTGIVNLKRKRSSTSPEKPLKMESQISDKSI